MQAAKCPRGAGGGVPEGCRERSPPPGVRGGAPGAPPRLLARAGGWETRRGPGRSPRASASRRRGTGGRGNPPGSGAEPRGLGLSTPCTGEWETQPGSGRSPRGSGTPPPSRAGGWANPSGPGAEPQGLASRRWGTGGWVGDPPGLGRSPRRLSHSALGRVRVTPSQLLRVEVVRVHLRQVPLPPPLLALQERRAERVARQLPQLARGTARAPPAPRGRCPPRTPRSTRGRRS